MLSKIFLTVIFFLSCQSEKKIVVHDCSKNIEANADIERTIELNKDFLIQNNIQIEIKKNDCGFTFINGNRKQNKPGSMTDVDFYLFVKDFYEITDSNPE